MTRPGDATPERSLLVYGLGRSGSAVVRRALSRGSAVAFYDARERGPDIDAALDAGASRLRDVTAAEVTAFDVCVAAPGVPIDHPDLEGLRAGGLKVIGEVEWTWTHVPGRYVGVTGTAGKGSTTLWLNAVLQAAGVDAIAGGNNDPALAAVAHPGATHVVELSSFQLERCVSFRPDVAVVLNLGQDHIDRHGSVAAYHGAKHRLLQNLGRDQTLVYNADDPVASAWASATDARSLGYSVQDPRADLFFDAGSGELRLQGEALLNERDLRVAGSHQRSNALAVAGAALALGLSPVEIAAGLVEFRGIRSRYETVATVGGVTFIDDSIATRPLAVSAALRSTPSPCVWLAGGVDKGADLAGLLPDVEQHVDLLVAFGASGPQLAERFRAVTEVRQCRQPDGREALRCAVAEALSFLRSRGGEGVVLLSPLAASFDQFDDYAHRARIFREVVAEATAAVGNGG